MILFWKSHQLKKTSAAYIQKHYRLVLSLMQTLWKKQVSMIRKYHNHTLRTNPQDREEEPLNTVTIHQEDIYCKVITSLFPVKIIAKQARRTQSTKQGPNTDPPQKFESNNKQWIINSRTLTSEWTAAKATRGGGWVNVFSWYQIFALNSVVVQHSLAHMGLPN